jgi:hypothetical protein
MLKRYEIMYTHGSRKETHMEIIKQEDIDESEIHQGREIQYVQYSLDAIRWYNEDTEKFRRYVYTDGSVSLPILRVDADK